MISFAAYTACLATVLAAVVRLVGSRRYLDRAGRHFLSVGMAASALAVALWAPATPRALGAAGWLGRLPFLLGNLATMIASWCLIATLAHTLGRRGVAAQLTAAHGLVAVSCCVSVFGLSLLDTVATSAAAQVIVIAYVVVGYGAFALVIGQRSLAAHTDPVTRFVLCTTVLSACTRVSWAVAQALVLAEAVAASRTVTAVSGLAEVLASVAVSIGAVGTTVAAWAPPILRARERWLDARLCRSLTPLWSVLVATVPTVVLAGFADPTDVGETLYRRVIEIRDAQMTLRPCLPPEAAKHAAAQAAVYARNRGIPPGAHTDLLSEAAELAAAVRAYRDGHRPRPTSAAADSVCHPAGTDPRAEAIALTQLSSTVFLSPLLRQLGGASARRPV